MDPQGHPDWCTRTACTAYGVEGDSSERYERWHHSEPLMVKTTDPTVALFVHKFAEADGTDEHIELTTVALPVARPWYLAQPIQGHTILIRQESVTALARAVAKLA